jgi:hypothetical protein
MHRTILKASPEQKGSIRDYSMTSRLEFDGTKLALTTVHKNSTEQKGRTVNQNSYKEIQ